MFVTWDSLAGVHFLPCILGILFLEEELEIKSPFVGIPTLPPNPTFRVLTWPFSELVAPPAEVCFEVQDGGTICCPLGVGDGRL